MEDFFKIPEDELQYTARCLRGELAKRGWKEALAVRSTKRYLIFATRPDGKKIRFCPCTPGNTGVISSEIADNKRVTSALFEYAGIPQPKTVLLSSDKGEMRKQLESLLQQYQKIVVKPTDGAHGDGVVTDITDIDEAMSAAVATCSKDGECNAIAQEQLQGEETEIRAICIGGKFVAAYKRIPAMVTGDGEHNIWELIEKENRELRAEAYHSDLVKIDIKGAKDYIEKHAVDANRVPERGEKVRVMAMCNIGMGGTVEEVELEPDCVALSEKIADITELPVVGIDFYGNKVIEINSGPSLYWPVRENGDKCVRAYADYLEQI